MYHAEAVQLSKPKPVFEVLTLQREIMTEREIRKPFAPISVEFPSTRKQKTVIMNPEDEAGEDKENC